MRTSATTAIALILCIGLGASAQRRVAHGGLIAPPVMRPAATRHFLRFSPDGRYIVAQDRSEVTVLSVEPLAILFRIPAKYAGQAQFTPDSRGIFFAVSAARAAAVDGGAAPRELLDRSAPYVERWSIADRAHIASTEIRLQDCPVGGLSPDSRALVCIDSHGTLRVIDVESGETIFERRQFAKPFVTWEDNSMDPFPRHESGNPSSARVRFSADGRFVVALPVDARGSAVAFDLRQRTAVRLTGELKRLRTEVENSAMQFTFVGAERVMMSPRFLVAHRRTVAAALVAFPSGEVLSKSELPPGTLINASDPGFILIWPLPWLAYFDPDYTERAKAVELSTGQVIMSDTLALDVIGNHYIAERITGELALYERGKPAPVATVRLDAP